MPWTFQHVKKRPATDLTGGERSAIRGSSERIRPEAIHRAVEFFIRLMRRC